jgi:hypothetical protein
LGWAWERAGRRRTRLGHRDRTPRTGEGCSTARGGWRRRRAIAVARRRKIEGTEEAWRRSPCGGAPVTRGRRGEATEKWVDDGPSSCGAPMAAAVSGLGFAREVVAAARVGLQGAAAVLFIGRRRIGVRA